jgi:uncharacterized membrane protein YbhN (UPF0104 family)
MDSLVRAAEFFVDHIPEIGWGAVSLAVLAHLGKVAARTRAWRNILATSYPEERVRWRHVAGGYTAGVAVNAVVPIRGGDVLKLYLVKHRVEGATYPTLGATLLVESIFDLAIGAVLLGYALWVGALPALDVLPHLPSIDWFWLLDNPATTLIVLAALAALGLSLFLLAAERIDAFRDRFAQGFAVLHDPRRYLRSVVGWQALAFVLRLATVFFFLHAFGVTATLDNALLAQVSQSLAAIVPLTPSGIGTEQALLAYVLRGEASTRSLLSFSVGMEFVLIAVNLLLGFLALVLMARTFRWRRLLHREPGLTPDEA